MRGMNMFEIISIIKVLLYEKLLVIMGSFNLDNKKSKIPATKKLAYFFI